MANKISSAQASYWLLLHLSGKSFRQIAKMVGKDREAIAKHVKRAAAASGGVTQVLLDGLLPKITEVYKAYFEQQMRRITAGKPADLRPAERLLTGLHIFRPCD
ncbi:MAG TPA: helix-turn-helix domain-containing protein [Vicinamibacterales bacterium]|nr:helix-turn-helix domain-containing protein [Vicinamibacterales bacterium]